MLLLFKQFYSFIMLDDMFTHFTSQSKRTLLNRALSLFLVVVNNSCSECLSIILLKSTELKVNNLLTLRTSVCKSHFCLQRMGAEKNLQQL
jgi:hypothetical protein